MTFFWVWIACGVSCAVAIDTLVAQWGYRRTSGLLLLLSILGGPISLLLMWRARHNPPPGS